MTKITTSIELKNAIQFLEIEHATNEHLLIEKFQRTSESLRPANNIAGILKEIAISPNFIGNIIEIAIGLGTGYFTKKIAIGTSGYIVRRLLGSFLQRGVTKVVSQHPQAFKSFGEFIQHILHKKPVDR